MVRFAARFARFAWAVLALVLAGCSRPSSAPGPIVLIVVDTLRADHVTCYGYDRPTAPNMCQLAESGVRFARAYAPRTNTTPSIASMLTGRYPYGHGIRDLYSLLPAETVTVAERLRDDGYRTGGFVSSFVMVHDFSGFEQGFEIYDDYVRTKEPFRDNYERHAKTTVSRMLRWLEKAGPHSFVFLHLIEPHGPYTPPDAQAEAFALPKGGRKLRAEQIPPYQRIPGVSDVNDFIGRYDGEIATVDVEIGRFLGRLREWGWYQSATIILIADHGESMGEDGLWFVHGAGLSEGETHVPLLVKFASGTPSVQPGTVVSEPVSVIDVFPTLLHAAGLQDPVDDVGTGVDLRLLASGAARQKPLPITENPMGAGLAFAAHGEQCTVKWMLPWSVLTDDRRLVNPRAAARWQALTTGVSHEPRDATEACVADVLQAVNPLMTEALSFTRTNKIVRRQTNKDGSRGAFVNQRGDPLVPLDEHEREALRQLGYLD